MDKLDSLGSNGLREQSTIAHALFILFKSALQLITICANTITSGL